MLALLSYKVDLPFYTELPTVQRPSVIVLDDKESDVRFPATFGDVGLSLEDHCMLEYGDEAPGLDFVHISSVKKRKPSSSVTKI